MKRCHALGRYPEFPKYNDYLTAVCTKPTIRQEHLLTHSNFVKMKKAGGNHGDYFGARTTISSAAKASLTISEPALDLVPITQLKRDFYFLTDGELKRLPIVEIKKLSGQKFQGVAPWITDRGLAVHTLYRHPVYTYGGMCWMQYGPVMTPHRFLSTRRTSIPRQGASEWCPARNTACHGYRG